MQITRHTDYALRTLMFVAALPPETLGSVADIAKRFNISHNHLVKVVKNLAHKGYLFTRRGRGGGISLKMAASEIRVGQVIRDMENSLKPIQCQELECPMASDCKLQSALNEAVAAYLAVLDTYTLADVLADNGTVQNLIQVLQIKIE